MSGDWCCERCGKVKDLTGDHLNGKTRVRSDCWPCAKKTTFVRQSSSVDTSVVLPSSAAQTDAFKNLIAAAAAAAATAQRSELPSTAPSKDSSSNHGATAALKEASAAPPPETTMRPQPVEVPTQAATPPTPFISNPFVTPAVSAASVKKFQTTYASSMIMKHDDPNAAFPPSAATTSAAATASTTVTGTPKGCSSVAVSAPYVMEKTAGTSPPFTFRPNANYAPSRSPTPGDRRGAAVSGTAATAAAAGGGGVGWSGMPLAPGTFPVLAAQLPSSTAGTKATTGVAAGATVNPFTSSDRTSSAPHRDPTTAAPPAAPASLDSAGPPQWICAHCHRAKDLKGSHLEGKASVRSDCWPCGKKRWFLLTNASAMASVVSLGSPKASSTASTVAPLPVKNHTTPEVKGDVHLKAGAVCRPDSTNVNPFAVPSGPTPPQHGHAAHTGAQPWVTPIIPSAAAKDDPFLLSPFAMASHIAGKKGPLPFPVKPASPAVHPSLGTDSSTSARVASPSRLAVTTLASPPLLFHTEGVAVDAATYYYAMARFDQQLLKTYRERLVSGVPPRAVRYGNVLYVVTGEPMTEAKNGGADLVYAFEKLGRCAALYLTIEHKLAGLRFRRVGRLFCPDEFSFAAACCYTNSFFRDEHTTLEDGVRGEGAGAMPQSVAPVKFRVYGPQPDPTKSLSLWGRVIGKTPMAQPCMVGEEQRVRAARTLYQRVGLLASPNNMTATAIQLSMEDKTKRGACGATEDCNDAHFMDVVLVTETMKLEDLPQAVSLMQAKSPFVS